MDNASASPTDEASQGAPDAVGFAVAEKLARERARAALWSDGGGSDVDTELALLHVALVDTRSADLLTSDRVPRDAFTGQARIAVRDAVAALRSRGQYAPFDPAAVKVALPEHLPHGLPARHVYELLIDVKAEPVNAESFAAALLRRRFDRLGPALLDSAAKALVDHDVAAHDARIKEWKELTPTFASEHDDPPWLEDRWLTVGEWGMDRDWLDCAPPPREFVLYRRDGEELVGVLAAGIVGMLIGAGGRGKSWLFILIALSIATGRSFIDGFVVKEPGDVLLVLAEEDAAELWRRIYDGARLLSLTDAEKQAIRSRIVVLPARGQDVALQRRNTTPSGRATSDPEETPFTRALVRRLNAPGRRWRLVVLDPLSRFAGMDVEIDNACATRYVEVLERLTMAPGNPAVLNGHHTNKSARSEKASASAARGSGALTDGARWVASLDGVKDETGDDVEHADLVLWRVPKTNYTPPVPPVLLERDRMHGGALRRAPADIEACILKKPQEKETDDKDATKQEGNAKTAPPRPSQGRIDFETEGFE